MSRLDTDKLRLLSRVRRRYQTTDVRLSFAGQAFPFTRVADPDVVLDRVAAAEEANLKRVESSRPPPLALPYWAELWDSAIGISQYLCTRLRTTPAFGNVLDLGCGMGLAGCVAASLGATVCFADLDPDALLFAKLNSLPWRSRTRTRRLDWRHDRLTERFDLIVGADILYERPQWEYLEPFWRAHLGSNGTILLGEPGRQTGDAFIPWIAGRGWTLTQHTEPVPTRTIPIRIFELNPL